MSDHQENLCAPATEPFRHTFVDVLADKDSTVARATATITTAGGIHTFQATGSSRRERGDSYDQFTGDALAVGRALVKLGVQMQKRAQSRINVEASIKAHHEEIARKKAEAAENAPPPFNLNAILRLGSVSRVSAASFDFDPGVARPWPGRGLVGWAASDVPFDASTDPVVECDGEDPGDDE